jgi:hypothetical protein
MAERVAVEFRPAPGFDGADGASEGMRVEPSGGDGPFPIRVARGARAVETELLAEIATLVEEGVRDPCLLRHPVRVVVPSRSLRAHLAAAMMRHFGRAVAGVSVQTLHAVALEIVENGSGVVPKGEALYPVLVHRYAREEPAFRDRLEDLIDGYGIVTDDVTDLLDAAFEAEHAEAIDEALCDLSRFPELALRARALVRVAARTLASMDDLEVGHRARLLRCARDLLVRGPAEALPARAVLIHGFAEATCLRADLLEALVRHRGARVFLDEPPDPANPSSPDVGRRFSARLRARLEGVASVERSGAAASTPSSVTALEAPGAQAEVRAVAERIRRLLDAGHCPEAIAVVSRDMAEYRAPLRLHFGRLGIPFSGIGETGSVGATRRRSQALLDLLRRRDRTPADRWLDAAVRFDPAEDRGARSDLRLGLRRIGVVRLEDVAEHRAGPSDVPLPAIGSWSDDGEAAAGSRGARAGRRFLRADDLARAVRGAGRIRQRLDRIHRAAALAERLDELHRLLVEDLGWDRQIPECAPVFSQLEGLAAELPPAFELYYDDFLLLLRRALERVGSEPLGGKGGGVQVLSVMEARARTFDELFLLGLNRDVFPRGVHQDPLLPDLVRRAIAVALPDIPIKSTGYDEERYLFAQLFSASPRITLSWQVTSDEGRDCAPSTFVERLRWGASEFVPLRVPPLHARPPPAAASGAPPEGSARTVFEQALLAGLHATRAEFAGLLPVAFEELDRELPDAVRSDRPQAAARGRLAVLDEFDPPKHRSAVLGPYFGFAGSLAGHGDPRRAPLYITTVERAARCSWQAFLSNLLRLEAPPDPLEALPGADPRLLGMLVHRVLEGFARAASGEGPRSLAEARGRAPVAVDWPESKELEARTHSAAREVLDDEGIALRGLEHVLAAQALPYLERARELDWPGAAPLPVVGVEVEGAIVRADARGDPREIRFRADRVDAADGDLVLTDYKTGRPISERLKEETRRRNLLEDVGRGRNLQAVVYALAAGGGGTGRFLFLRPELDPRAAALAVRADAEEFARAFESALGAVSNAWDAGAFFPRLLENDLQKENPECERCELAVACLRGDTGSRQRFARWLEDRRSAGEALAAPERALLDLWSLHEKRPSRASGGRG